MSKRKFNIGDKVVIASKYKNRYNSITTVGKIFSVGSKGDRASYLVNFEDNAPLFTLYSYELDFADMHVLAEHCRKELKQTDKDLYSNVACEMYKQGFDDVLDKHCRKDLIASEKFHKGDIIRLVGTEKVGFVAEILEPCWQYKIFTDSYQICNIHAIEHASESDLFAYQRSLYCDGIPKSIKCKYCGEPFDDDLIIESSDEPGVCEWCAKQRKKMSKIHNRKSIAVDLKDFSIFGKDGDWLEVTEWTNGEGIDIDIHYDSDHDEDLRKFQLSYDELGIIMNIVNKFGTLPIIYTDEEK